MNEERLDVFLHLNGFAPSREKAKQLIIGNCVYVDGKLINKPAERVYSSSEIKVINNFQYVGRGASKIEKAINYFNIYVNNKIAIDVGASTGGFTDYLLSYGAKKVYAIDVGHNQLNEKLKNDKRVVNLEGTNFRYMDSKIFKESIDIIVVDVSFISLKLILPKICEIIQKNSDVVILIKPQFEAGKNNIGKNGIVKDKKIHLAVLNNINDYCISNNLHINNITYSPIKGGDGNIEYLAHLKVGTEIKFQTENFKSIIKETFDLL